MIRARSGPSPSTTPSALPRSQASRLIGFSKIWERGAALTLRLHSFEMEVLAQEENLVGLAALHRERGKAEPIESPRRVLLDMRANLA